jgi:outer membrane lipoprotein SlyB
MNIAGLVDNDSIIGQLGGSVLGGLAGAKLFGLKPYGTINAALAGGALGGLFDVLRSKKEQEEQYQQQYY